MPVLAAGDLKVACITPISSNAASVPRLLTALVFVDISVALLVVLLVSSLSTVLKLVVLLKLELPSVLRLSVLLSRLLFSVPMLAVWLARVDTVVLRLVVLLIVVVSVLSAELSNVLLLSTLLVVCDRLPDATTLRLAAALSAYASLPGSADTST
jgi:hypothetical protein